MNFFANKTVLIAGASKGLGKTLALKYESEGASLVLLGRDEEKLNSITQSFKSPEKHKIILCEVLDKESWTQAFKKLGEIAAKIDIVVHCTGGGIGISQDLPNSADMWKVFEVNLGFAAEINSLIIPYMKERKAGNIIHVSSINGTHAIGNVTYSTFKAAIAGYVRMLGNNLAKDSIVLSGIVPGAFYSEEGAMARFEKFNPEGYEGFLDTKLPNKKMPLAEDFWPLVKVLSSEQGYVMAGSLIALDGGQATPFAFS